MAKRATNILNIFLPLFLIPMSAMSSAQELFLQNRQAAPTQIVMPTDSDIEKSRSKMSDLMNNATKLHTQKPLSGDSSLPKVERIPSPNPVPATDISTIAEKFNDIAKAQIPQNTKPELMVMVSLSMPRAALVRIIEQAEKSGATLVFRGLKGNSMNQMGAEIKALIGNHQVEATIHPPAFQQFSITQVPVVVIAYPKASSIMDNGCAEADTFVKVAGDVTLEYALDYIQRKSPNWAEVASGFRKKLQGEQ